MTSRLIFDTVELKKKGVSIKVRTDLREVLSSQCDFPLYIRNSMEHFTEFDFSGIQDSLDKYGEFFFLDEYFNDFYKNQMLDYLKKTEGKTSLNEKIDFSLNLLKNSLLKQKPMETNRMVFDRVKRTREKITNFVKENGIKDGELAVVAHSRFIRAFLAEGFDDEKDIYIDTYRPKNAEVLEINI